MQLSEDLLQYIWRKRAFDTSDLCTTDGSKVSILNAGQLNRNAGPDFLNAHIRIGEIEWVGNVEVHIESSMWQAHGHRSDPAYDNVILHVVLRHDHTVRTSQNNAIPTIELQERINPEMVNRYQDLMSNLDDIPCHRMIHQVEQVKVRQWMDRKLVQRSERKAETIARWVKEFGGDVQKAFFVSLARSFGSKVNAEAFQRLAECLPLNVLMIHRSDLLQIEALLFGTASLLSSEHRDEYPRMLNKEYQFLKIKYGLNSINRIEWKWHRIRPSGFPTLRISQMANLLSRSGGEIMEMLESEDVEELTSMLRSPANDYWGNHSQFDRPCKKVGLSMGGTSARNIMINTIVPFQFFLANKRNRSELREYAMNLLEGSKAEDNRIVRRWKELGLDARNAADTQALIELFNVECLNKKCLFCGIGGEIIGQRDHRKANSSAL